MGCPSLSSLSALPLLMKKLCTATSSTQSVVRRWFAPILLLFLNTLWRWVHFLIYLALIGYMVFGIGDTAAQFWPFMFIDPRRNMTCDPMNLFLWNEIKWSSLSYYFASKSWPLTVVITLYCTHVGNKSSPQNIVLSIGLCAQCTDVTSVHFNEMRLRTQNRTDRGVKKRNEAWSTK